MHLTVCQSILQEKLGQEDKDAYSTLRPGLTAMHTSCPLLKPKLPVRTQGGSERGVTGPLLLPSVTVLRNSSSSAFQCELSLAGPEPSLLGLPGPRL